jgi:hypothetical protein
LVHYCNHEIFQVFRPPLGAFAHDRRTGSDQLVRHHYRVSCRWLPQVSFQHLVARRSANIIENIEDLGIAADAYEKAKAFIAPLNNTQKIAIVMATSFTSDNASWSAYTNTDGVDGLNFYFFVSAFAMGNALTQTWNRDLIAAQFGAVGAEYFATGNNMVDGALLGPLGRVPEGSRSDSGILVGKQC